MLQRITELKPDLVIKDAGYEAMALKRLLLTPTDWHLMRQCPVPLLLIHDTGRPLPTRIIAAVDAGPYEPQAQELNHRIVRAAQELAFRSGAELHLVFALSPMTDIAAAVSSVPPSFSSEAYTAMLAMRTKAFESLAQEHRVPADRRHLLAGLVGPAVAARQRTRRGCHRRRRLAPHAARSVRDGQHRGADRRSRTLQRDDRAAGRVPAAAEALKAAPTACAARPCG